MPKIAILGIGLMGAALAQRFAQVGGYELTLWNRTRARAEAVGVGRVASTPADAAAEADVVQTCLFDPQALRQVYYGSSGLLSVARGQLFIESTTVGPGAVRELHADLSAKGCPIVDAPLIGSSPAVLGGDLLIPVGGSRSDYEQAEPVLASIGKPFYAGGPGTAAALKLVHNSLLAVITASAAELLTAGVAAGLSAESVFAIMQRLSPYLAKKEAAMVRSEYLPVRFALNGILKDLGLALDMYRGAGAATPLTAATRELFAEAAVAHGEADMAAVLERYRALAPTAVQL